MEQLESGQAGQGKQKDQNIPGKCQKHIEKMPDMGVIMEIQWSTTGQKMSSQKMRWNKKGRKDHENYIKRWFRKRIQ